MPDPWDSAEGQTHCIGDGCMPPHRAEEAAMTHTPPPTQDDLAAGRELDAEVATKLFGFKPFEIDGYWQYIPSGKPRRTHMIDSVPLPAFSTDIRAAWQIVEQWREKTLSLRLDVAWIVGGGNPWRVEVWLPEMSDSAVGMADTAPLAICRAALKVVATPKETPADA